MSGELTAYTALAERLADAAGAIARRYFRTLLVVSDKHDASPVTIADREAEAAMRGMIEAAYPDHGIVGEEHESRNPGASHVWVLDPIDGTKAFITGRPLFGTLIALCRDGQPAVGVIDCPAMGERWVGTAGQATFYRGRLGPEGPARVRSCAALADAALGTTSPDLFDAEARPRFERVRRAAKLPIYGGDCYAYALVANGSLDLVIEAGLKPYDWAALVPVIEGAGGRITDWRGKRLDLGAAASRVLAAGDARVHDEASRLLEG